MDKMIDAPETLSFESDHAVFRLTGEYTFEKTVDLVDEAIAHCKKNEVPKLLVNLLGVTGFPSPTTVQRYLFATKWAATAVGHVTVAVVAPAELIDPDRIGVTISRNRGMEAQVFTDEAEGIAWLRSPS